MIWIISNVAEESGRFTTYNQFKKAYPEGEMDIYCASGPDEFSFIKPYDTAIIRTRNKEIYESLTVAQRRIGFKSTLESFRTLELTYDKEILKMLLEREGIPYPKTVSEDDLEEGKFYFVKPLYGEDSIGVDEMSKCKGKQEVMRKCRILAERGLKPIVEEYIGGIEVTTSIIGNEGKVFSAIVAPNNPYGFHTHQTKKEYDFVAKRFSYGWLTELAIKLYKAIGAKHYIRIDSRVKNGVPYIIDVNMIAGLNMKGYMAKCLEVNGVGYYDFIRKVVNSATLLEI